MTKIKSAQEWATELWQSMVDNTHTITWRSFIAEDIILKAQAEAWEAGREAASTECKRSIHILPRREREIFEAASQDILALPNPFKESKGDE